MGRLEVTVRQRRPVEGLRQEGLEHDCEQVIWPGEGVTPEIFFTDNTESVCSDVLIRVLLEMSELCSSGMKQLVLNVEGEVGPEDMDKAEV